MIASQVSRARISSHRYAVADRPSVAGGLPAPPSAVPRLNGRKWVLSPASLVVIHTSSLDSAKCTSARVPNPNSGCGLPVAGSFTVRSCLYWLIASDTDCVKSVFNSSVATGSPLTNSTRSREWFEAVE